MFISQTQRYFIMKELLDYVVFKENIRKRENFLHHETSQTIRLIGLIKSGVFSAAYPLHEVIFYGLHAFPFYFLSIV